MEAEGEEDQDPRAQIAEDDGPGMTSGQRDARRGVSPQQLANAGTDDEDESEDHQRPAPTVPEVATIPIFNMNADVGIYRHNKKQRVATQLPMEPDWQGMAARLGQDGFLPIVEAVLDYACNTGHRAAMNLREASSATEDTVWVDMAGQTLCSMH
jgi:hypothetical protein